MAAALEVSDGIQEALENIREIHATNQEQRYLDSLNGKIDAHECTMIKGELATGLFVNGASVIMRLLAGKTVLVIAHRMRTVENADKIVVLSEGSVVEEGSPAELLAREGSVFARMHALQSASAQWSL